jgi:hypothetical protein
MKYCILWGLTFGIATFFQIEKPFQVKTEYISSTEASLQKNLLAEIKCFNLIFKIQCNTSFTEAEAEIRILHSQNTRNLKMVYNWPQFHLTGENFFLFPFESQGIDKLSYLSQ